jgi:hypothetical protein
VYRILTILLLPKIDLSRCGVLRQKPKYGTHRAFTLGRRFCFLTSQPSHHGETTMKKIFTLCGTLVAVTLLSTACSHSKKMNEEAAVDSTLIPRQGTTADPITTEHVAPATTPRLVTVENNAVPRDTNRITTEPTASLEDANLGASSSGRGR